jgi:hypothetical protein
VGTVQSPGCVDDAVLIKGVAAKNNDIHWNGPQRLQAVGRLAPAASYLYMMLAAQCTAQQLRLSLIGISYENTDKSATST